MAWPLCPSNRFQESCCIFVLTQGNTEEKFVESRKKFLNYFCQKIAERNYFFNSDVFQVFIKGAEDFEKACK